MGTTDRCHSTLILASLMICWYFSISSLIYFAKYSGVEPIGSKPSVANCFFTSGCLTNLATSDWILITKSTGMFFGPQAVPRSKLEAGHARFRNGGNLRGDRDPRY